MRIEILVDPDTKEYQFDVDGNLLILIAALRQVLQDLEDPEILDDLEQEPH